MPHRSDVSTDDLAALLAGVATGKTSVETAVSRLTSPPGNLQLSSADTESAGSGVSLPLTLDLDRQRRCGFAEVIYGAGKPAELIAEIMRRQRQAGQDSLATRVTDETAKAVAEFIPEVRYNPDARCLLAGAAANKTPSPLDMSATRLVRHVAVVTAGSTDAPVCEEAIETLHWMGIPFRSFNDIGVAGPDRLLAAVPELRQAAAVIVIAGMEGALPAAVGGHLSVPVFAVPTSVGYGATLGGLTPLMGMLSCCSSNVAVVNIDAGFKAAYLSGLVVKSPEFNRPENRNASDEEE
ncbi:nickel pincer cofactor biosynthesis protein LarB [Roseiconus lacunae]|uniref:nickel pincer cofactor biosynthesis protein LarB n=1 Tax=Roseiconus lacunae TaxID=2605694 RepID=UPI0011F37C0C|nr:nickel pincer cofactor biosynthesis protein LarB [Roseiconus lacunae]